WQYNGPGCSGGSALAQSALRDALCAADVLDSLSSGFAFDDDRAVKVKLLQAGKEFRPIHFPGSSRNLLAPSARLFRGPSVFEVNLAQPRTEHFDRLDWIAYAIKNHVGRIEVHSHVRPIQLFEHCRQQRRGFLARFQTDGDFGTFENIGNLPEATKHFVEVFVTLVVRQESGMEGDEFKPEHLRQRRRGLNVLPIILPGCVGSNAAGEPDRVQG